MKDFEKDLQAVRGPEVRVDEFRRTLRRDLRRSMRASGTRSWKVAFGLSSAAAGALAVLLAVFVLDPDVPARLHASVAGGVASPAGAVPLAGTDSIPSKPDLQLLLDQVNASARVDRAFLETWYEDRARPVQVKAVEDEKILAIRQFELSSGERVIVLTELGTQLQRKDVQTVSNSLRNF